MSPRAEQLARRVEQGPQDLIAAVQNLTDEQWGTRCGSEQRSVEVLVHHVGTMYPLEAEVVTTVARGGTSPPATGCGRSRSTSAPAVWGLGQLGTGHLSDRLGRKSLIAGGMLVQALGIFLIVATDGFAPWALGAVLLGVGTAMVYPTLLATIGDVAHPEWRTSAVGVYRLWRDGGYAIGALLAGIVADVLGLRWAIGAVGLLALASGFVAATVMTETLATRRPASAPPARRPVPGSD